MLECQGSVFYSLLCILTLMVLLCSLTVGNIIFLLNTAKFLSPTLELHTHASICLINSSTWMSSIYLQLSMSETILLISCSFPSLLYLDKWSLHLSCCSGQTNLLAILNTLLSSQFTYIFIRKSCCFYLQNISGFFCSPLLMLPSQSEPPLSLSVLLELPSYWSLNFNPCLPHLVVFTASRMILQGEKSDHVTFHIQIFQHFPVPSKSKSYNGRQIPT